MLCRRALPLLLVAPALVARAEAPPAWVQGAGTDPALPASTHLTGYGVAGPGGTPAEQLRQASAMAREALASSIRTRVTSEFTSRVTLNDKAMSRFAENLVRTRADLDLEGLDANLVWRDARKDLCHVLAVLDKGKALRLLRARLERGAAECAAAQAAGAGLAELRRARQLRERFDEDLLVASVLQGGPVEAPACPDLAGIDAALRRGFAAQRGLDGPLGLAALDLGERLPAGTRLLMDRVTYADTPFCGSFSAYLEQALGTQLASLGQLRMLDKAAGAQAMREGGMEAGLAGALHAQAVIRGTCFEVGGEVKLDLRASTPYGEDLAASHQSFPAALLAQAGLQLAPANLEEARKALAIANAEVRDSKLRVVVAPDRGDAGIYRQGDRLHLFLKASMDCYVRVIYQQVDGSIVQVFPNRYHPDGRIRRAETYQIPPDEASFVLQVQAPFGVEMIKVLASTEPIEVPAGAPDAHGLRQVQEDLGQVLARTRGIGLKKAETQYAEATAVVNTLPGQ